MFPPSHHCKMLKLALMELTNDNNMADEEEEVNEPKSTNPREDLVEISFHDTLKMYT